MASKDGTKQGPKHAKLKPVAVIVSRYNAAVTTRLRQGAEKIYVARGGKLGKLDVFEAPGAFELTVLASEAALTGRYAGVVVLGCVIKGDTRHDEYINHAVAQGITQASIEMGVPIAFGLVTTENAAQARARSGGDAGNPSSSNKGEEAMNALLDTITAIDAVRRGTPASINRDIKDKAAHQSTKVKR
jgi:6,7-dimethyl-8-ribityllumazine synthase